MLRTGEWSNSGAGVIVVMIDSKADTFVELTVSNMVSRRFVKKQSMRLTQRGGAHLLL